MKNWEKLEPDKYALLDVHFNRGRSRPIDRIVIHHNAGIRLTTEQLRRDIWAKGAREASAHYQVEADGTIGQLVNDWDTAWHAGDLNINARSIGIEHANISGAPSWQISEATIEEGAHLVAALCRAYNLGRPEWDENVFPHSRYSRTSCPAQLDVGGEDHTAYMTRAQFWYDNSALAISKESAMNNEKIDEIHHELTHRFQSRYTDAKGRRSKFRDTIAGYILEADRKLETGGVYHLTERLDRLESKIDRLAEKN